MAGRHNEAISLRLEARGLRLSDAVTVASGPVNPWDMPRSSGHLPHITTNDHFEMINGISQHGFTRTISVKCLNGFDL